MSMATTPEGPRVESRHAERVSEVRPEDGIGRQREAEVVSRQSPERYTEKVEKAPSSSPKKKFSTKSRSTSFIDGEEKRGIRAEGLQELLQEVYDKFRRCSAQLREADRGQLLVPGSNAGAEDTDLGDTWQEVEWLRQAVVGMHSHLLLAQKRQHVLEKKCKEFQEKIAEARSGGAPKPVFLLTQANASYGPATNAVESGPEGDRLEESPAGVALANMPCSYTINHTTSTPRGRPPVTVQPPAQIRAASAPQVGLHQRQMLPKSHASASELALASPRWTGQAAQTYVPVYAASPNFLPLASRRIPMTSFEGSTIFFPSPQSAGTESPAQGVRAWLSSPRLAPATPVPPLTPPVPLTPLASPRLGTPRLAPRCAPVTAPVTASPAATPPVPGPGSSRVQSLRSQRFFRHWLQSYKLLQLCRRRASSAANSPGIVAAFHAWCSYGRARQAKEQLRRTAQRFRRRQLLRKTLRRFQGGVEEARDAETRAGRFHGLKAGQLTKQLFGSWQQLALEVLRAEALSGFQLYQGWRRGKIAAQATARTVVLSSQVDEFQPCDLLIYFRVVGHVVDRSHQRMQSIKRCLDTFKSFIDMRRRTAAARAALHRSTRRRRRSGAVGAWRARSVELRSARRQDEMTAMAHHTRCPAREHLQHSSGTLEFG
eukprot:g23826.t1